VVAVSFSLVGSEIDSTVMLYTGKMA